MEEAQDENIEIKVSDDGANSNPAEGNAAEGGAGEYGDGNKGQQEQEVGDCVAAAPKDAADAVNVAQLAALKSELSESRDRYVRLMADFENFKKRSLKEQSELLKYQGERLVVDMLEVLDNLELALSYTSAEFDKLKTGLEMVHKLFIERLAKWDIRGESGIGENFDPQRHSAISRVPGSNAKPGTIMGELKKAYFYKDKLIRHGEVVVATEGE